MANDVKRCPLTDEEAKAEPRCNVDGGYPNHCKDSTDIQTNKGRQRIVKYARRNKVKAQ